MSSINYDPATQTNVQRIVLTKQEIWELTILVMAELLTKKRRQCKP